MSIRFLSPHTAYTNIRDKSGAAPNVLSPEARVMISRESRGHFTFVDSIHSGTDVYSSSLDREAKGLNVRVTCGWMALIDFHDKLRKSEEIA
jgi:hypothetical protein